MINVRKRLFLLVVFVTVAAIALKVYLGLTDAALGAELVQNPGFETAGGGGTDIFASWWEGEYYNYLTDVGTKPGDGVIDSATSHGGTHAAALTNSTTILGWREVSQEIAVTPLAKYRFSFWHRGDGSHAARYALRNTVTNELITPPNQYGGGAIDTGNISTTYVQTTFDFFAPAGCTTLSIQLGTAHSPGTVYVDDVSLKEITWSFVDKSADVLQTPGVTWGRGFEGGRILDLVARPGIAKFLLDNSASSVTGRLQGQYSPAHANVLTGFALGMPVKLTLAVNGGAETTEFIGRTSAIRPSAGIYRNEVVEVEATDWMGYLASQLLGLTTLDVDRRMDQGITAALVNFPIQPEAVDFDAGVETFLTMFDSETAQTSMAEFFSKLARNEFGRVFVRADGTLEVENRYARPLSLTSAFTLAGQMSQLQVAYELADVANIILATIYPAKIDTVAVRIFDLANAGCPAIAPGETLTFICPYSNPLGGGEISATSVVDPVTVFEFGSRGNYVSDDLHAFLSQANEVGANATIAHLTNTASKTGHLNDFQIYGLGIYHYSPIELEARDDFDIYSNGEHRATYRLELITDPNKGRNYADFILDKVGRQHVVVRMVSFNANQDATLAAAAAAAEISQRFTLTEAATGLSEDFFINSLAFAYQGNQLEVTMVAVPWATYRCWIWDTSTWDNTDGEGWTL